MIGKFPRIKKYWILTKRKTVSHSQTTYFQFNIMLAKRGSGTLTLHESSRTDREATDEMISYLGISLLAISYSGISLSLKHPNPLTFQGSILFFEIHLEEGGSVEVV